MRARQPLPQMRVCARVCEEGEWWSGVGRWRGLLCFSGQEGYKESERRGSTVSPPPYLPTHKEKGRHRARNKHIEGDRVHGRGQAGEDFQLKPPPLSKMRSGCKGRATDRHTHMHTHPSDMMLLRRRRGTAHRPKESKKQLREGVPNIASVTQFLR